MGRKKGGGDQDRQMVSVSLTSVMKQKLAILKEETGFGTSELLRMGLDKLFRERIEGLKENK